MFQNNPKITCPKCSYVMTKPFKAFCPKCNINLTEFIDTNKFMKERLKIIEQACLRDIESNNDLIISINKIIGKLPSRLTSKDSKQVYKSILTWGQKLKKVLSNINSTDELLNEIPLNLKTDDIKNVEKMRMEYFHPSLLRSWDIKLKTYTKVFNEDKLLAYINILIQDLKDLNKRDNKLLKSLKEKKFSLNTLNGDLMCPKCLIWLDKDSIFCKICGIKVNSKSRYIPSQIRGEVWKRDTGQCVQCGKRDDLQFDHIIPYSKGGGNSVENIQILCGECNRKKYNKI